MKKIIISIFLILILFSVFSYADINISGCQSSIFNTSNTVFTECSPDPLTAARNCSRLVDFNLTFADNIWMTELASPIPPNTGSAVFETSDGFKYSFSFFEMYIVPHVEPQNPPRNFTLEIFKNGAWETTLDIKNFYNDTEACRGTGTIGLGADNPKCNRFNVNVVDAEKIRLNVTHVECPPPCTNKHLVISEIMGCGIPVDVCNFPSLFCDSFNYIEPLSTREWLVQLGSGTINNSFNPVNNELQLNNDQFIAPFHETQAFSTSYRPDSGSRFTRHFLSPVFSSQFDLNFTSEIDNIFRYAAFEKVGILAYVIEARIDPIGNASGNVSWYYQNATQPSSTFKLLCANCSRSDEYSFIKINTFFSQREEFPFNSSVETDKVEVYANNALMGSFDNFLDPRTNYLSQYEFIKFDSSNYTVDNYFVMVGLDKDTSTFEKYYTDKFDNLSIVDDFLESEGTGDLADAVNSIWDDFGLKSQTSKIMSGIFLMFLLAIFIYGAALSTGTNLSPIALLVIEMFFMIFLVYIKLLPIWLPFVLVLGAAGIGMVIFKIMSQ